MQECQIAGLSQAGKTGSEDASVITFIKFVTVLIALFNKDKTIGSHEQAERFLSNRSSDSDIKTYQYQTQKFSIIQSSRK